MDERSDLLSGKSSDDLCQHKVHLHEKQEGTRLELYKARVSNFANSPRSPAVKPDRCTENIILPNFHELLQAGGGCCDFNHQTTGEEVQVSGGCARFLQPSRLFWEGHRSRESINHLSSRMAPRL